MKTSILLKSFCVVSASILFLFSSCSSYDDAYYISFDLKEANGVKTFDVRDNPLEPDIVTATGVWTLTNDVFDAQFNYQIQPNIKYNYTAQYDSANGKLKNGTFGINPSNTDLGTWNMSKE
jgi:hypothetical protein